MLTPLLDRARHTADGDAGVTLTELIVAMGLTVILGAITMTLFLTVSSSASTTTDRTVGASQAGTGLQAWASYLQVADSPTSPGSTKSRIEWLTAGDMLFYADLNNRGSAQGVNSTGLPVMVWLRLDTTGQLVEEQFASTAALGAAPTVCRILATSVTASALFTAYDTSGAAMSGEDLGTAPAPSAGCQRLPVTVPSQSSSPDATAASDLQNVGSVAIDFFVTDSTGTRSQEYSTVATLPLLGGSS